MQICKILEVKKLKTPLKYMEAVNSLLAEGWELIGKDEFWNYLLFVRTINPLQAKQPAQEEAVINPFKGVPESQLNQFQTY